MERKEFTVTNEGITPSSQENITQVIFQRHGDHENSKLTEESITDQTELIKHFIEKLLNTSSLENIQNTDFLFLASPTSDENEFKRSVATTNIAMQAVKLAFEQIDSSKEHILNLAKDLTFKESIKPLKNLEGSRILTDNTGYADLLTAKYGEDTEEFWGAFDDDPEEEKRIELGSEGPYDIADRGLKLLRVFKRYADLYHIAKPAGKLIIWCGTHYDIISNLTKRDFLEYDKTDVVYVDNCGGMSFDFNKDGTITVNINGTKYPYKLPEANKKDSNVAVNINGTQYPNELPEANNKNR